MSIKFSTIIIIIAFFLPINIKGILRLIFLLVFFLTGFVPLGTCTNTSGVDRASDGLKFQESVEASSNLTLAVSDDDLTNLRVLFETQQIFRNGMPSFHGKQCGTDQDCYDLLTNSLECNDSKCVCLYWKGIQLIWNETRGVCLSAPGHPCVTDKMCFSDKCVNEVCVSGAVSKHSKEFSFTFLCHVLIFQSILFFAFYRD